MSEHIFQQHKMCLLTVILLSYVGLYFKSTLMIHFCLQLWFILSLVNTFSLPARIIGTQSCKYLVDNYETLLFLSNV